MTARPPLLRPALRAALAGLCGLAASTAVAGTAMAAAVSLYDFTGGSDGSAPYGGLVGNSSGVLYGTAYGGGANGLGAVFSLTPPAAGASGWTPGLVYSFGTTAQFGTNPQNGLLRDSSGNLYGTTSAGGNGTKKAGAAFMLLPPKGTRTTWLARFLATLPGTASGPLVQDSAGNVYGTTVNGGTSNAGMVFKISPTSAARTSWVLSTLHVFKPGSTDGVAPVGGVILDGSGKLYGVTAQGGTTASPACPNPTGCGVLYSLTPPAAGATAWKETILRSFATTTGGGGILPAGALQRDSSGNLYGVTQAGGASGAGTVYRLAPPATGKTAWTQTTLYNFKTDGIDGTQPLAGLLRDSSGKLFGTTSAGGLAGLGTIFGLTPPSSGTNWQESASCSVYGENGTALTAPLLMDSAGLLYGTSTGGGSGAGNVFVYSSPNCPPPVFLTPSNGYRTAQVALSNNNLTADITPGYDYAQIAANHPHNSGKWYFTVTENAADPSAHHEFGIIRQDSVGISLETNHSETADFLNAYGFVGSSSNWQYDHIPTISPGMTATFKIDFDNDAWYIVTGGVTYGPWAISGPAISRDPTTGLFPPMLPYFGIGDGSETASFSFLGGTTSDGFAAWDDLAAKPQAPAAASLNNAK